MPAHVRNSAAARELFPSSNDVDQFVAFAITEHKRTIPGTLDVFKGRRRQSTQFVPSGTPYRRIDVSLCQARLRSWQWLLIALPLHADVSRHPFIDSSRHTQSGTRSSAPRTRRETLLLILWRVAAQQGWLNHVADQQRILRQKRCGSAAPCVQSPCLANAARILNDCNDTSPDVLRHLDDFKCPQVPDQNRKR
jgi:hypothetical protein